MKKFMKLFTLMLAVSIAIVGCGSKDDNNNNNNGGGDVVDKDITVTEAFQKFQDTYENEPHVLSFEMGSETGKIFIESFDKFAMDITTGGTNIFINCGVNNEYVMKSGDLVIDDKDLVSSSCEDDSIIETMYDEMDLDSIKNLLGLYDSEETSEYFSIKDGDTNVIVYKNGKKISMTIGNDSTLDMEITDIVLPE